MIELLNIKKLKRQRLNSLLGITLDGSKLEGVVLRRTNGSLQVQQTFSVSLSLDPLTADAELVGREIRNHLDASGVRERYCVVGVPLKWALTTHVEIPNLPEADIPSFLQIEAERGFPSDVQTLRICKSICRSASGKRHALMAGIPNNHLALLDNVLRAAKLKPISFSLGIAALQPADTEHSDGVLALAIGETHVALQVTAGMGVAALRALEGALETEGGRRILHAELVAREARITLGQLPAELRDLVHRIRIFGPRDLSQRLADEIELRLEAMGLKVEIVTRYGPKQIGLTLPAEATVSPALSLAADRLAERATVFEFLPPRVTPLQQLAARYASGRLRTVGVAAAAAAVIVGGLFLFQQVQLIRLRSQWNGMASKVHELQTVEQQIRQFRPWSHESVRGLSILRQLTSAFPEEGVVSAKTVEIRDLSAVSCSGIARDNPALLKTLDKLRATDGISDLKVSQIRGKSPIQFTFDFHWNEGGKNEN
jgi:hypothetical protein